MMRKDLTPRRVSAGVRVINRVYHVQNVNAYGSRLKEWMRRFHGVIFHRNGAISFSG